MVFRILVSCIMNNPYKPKSQYNILQVTQYVLLAGEQSAGSQSHTGDSGQLEVAPLDAHTQSLFGSAEV